MKENDILYLKRLIADVIDFILIMILFLLFHFCVVTPISNQYFHLNEKNQTYTQLLEDSFLYQKNEKNQWVEINNFVKIDHQETIENYLASIQNFYTSNHQAIQENKWIEIEELLLKNENFKQDEQQICLKEEADLMNVVETLNPIYEQALQYFQQTQEYVKIYHDISNQIMINFFISMFLSFFILTAIVPISRKDGVTIGKRIQQLQMVTKKDQTRVKKYQLLIRFIMVYLFQIIVPFLCGQYFEIFYTFPLMLTLILMTFSKQHLAIHDYIANTQVIRKGENETK